MRVICTAGHVDHGKSSLVEKISGIQPDRLAEEQRRSMTIDLGFAWVQLPDGSTVGIVDVPGHRNFIENMLAGLGGIDAALLVIAADEGIMPQTREHLAILSLLGIDKLLVVLTKIDLIEDSEWLELVCLEVEDLLAEYSLEAPILPVSAVSGAGIDELLTALQALLQHLPPPLDRQQPRLPADRVFTVSGFGTVVTGTLLGGALTVGDTVEMQPSGIRGRVRGLQSYQRDVSVALPGNRVAVNVAGLNGKGLRRGEVLCKPNQLQPSRLLDAHFQQLPGSSRPLAHNAEVKFFCGAAESMARVRLLDTDEVGPGEQAWLQIRLRDATALAAGDRYILRCPSPSETIGGGIIVSNRSRRHKRFQPAVLKTLHTRLHGSLSEKLVLAATQAHPSSPADLRRVLACSAEEWTKALASAEEQELLVQLEDGRVWASSCWQSMRDAVVAELALVHHEQPLRLGLSRAELASRLGQPLSLLAQAVAADTRMVADGRFVRLRAHSIQFMPAQQQRVTQLQLELANNSAPPSIAELNARYGEALVRALLDMRQLVQVSDSVVFAVDAYERMVAVIRAYVGAEGQIDAKTLRDMFGTSRKYAIALLEHLDALGITQRVGDERIAGRNM